MYRYIFQNWLFLTCPTTVRGWGAPMRPNPCVLNVQYGLTNRKKSCVLVAGTATGGLVA